MKGKLLNAYWIEDVEYIKKLVDGYIKGEIDEHQFKKERLKNGIYGQRQKGFFMIRVKVPGGEITPEQLKTLAEIGDRYSNGILHITTRQDIQYHWVKLEDIPQAVEIINECGLTTKDACGDTVRNITSCCFSGICPLEVINAGQCARITTEKFIGIYRNLPRKFKITFSGCEKDCAYARFNDVGIIATTKENKHGFKVYVGGGQGDTPHIGKLLIDFVKPEYIPSVIKAVLEVFNKYGDRRNKRRNRLKFLIERVGFEKFKDLFWKEYKHLKKEDEDFNPKTYLPRGNFHLVNPIVQKDGKYALNILLRKGNITSPEVGTLTDIAIRYSLNIRLTQDQNILLYNIPEEYFNEIKDTLVRYGFDIKWTGSIKDIVCCPGSETCSLGITSSRGVAEALEKTVDKFSHLPVRIKISGCPNSCGHHHIADIGLHGVAKKINGKLAPHYVFHFGGTPTKIGEKSLKIPAKNVPNAVEDILIYYETSRQENETFTEFLERVGEESFKDILEKHLHTKEDIDYFKDFGSDKEFSLEEVGVGECMGIVADMVETSISEAERMVSQAKAHIQQGFEEDASVHLKEALTVVCKGMLVPFGIKAEGEEAILKFAEHVIGRRYVDEKFLNLLKKENPSVGEVEEFISACRKAYELLKRQTKEKLEKGIKDKARKEIMDLRNEECPYNFILAKQKIESMEIGSVLVVLLKDEESVRSVSASMRDHGHEVIDIDQENSHYVLTVRRR